MDTSDDLRKQISSLERQLDESRANREFMFENSPACNAIIGVDNRIIGVNRTFLNLLGYDLEEVTGRSVFDFIKLSSHTEVERQLIRDFTGAITSELEAVLISSDGSEKTLLFSGSPLLLENVHGEKSILVTGINITHRKQKEKELEAADKRWRAFISSVDDLVYFQTLDGKITYLNKSHLKVTGYSAKEFETNEELWSDILDPEDLKRNKAFFKIHPEKSAFNDIFSKPLDFHNKSFFKDLFIGDQTILYSIAGFYFEKKYFREAAEVYGILEENGEVSAEVLQKMGYAFQKQEDDQKALDCYLKADILLPENVWNLKKIGLCYRYLKQPDKALPYYRQAEYQDPENLHTEISIAHCLLDLQKHEEALKSYFKVEYLAPDNHKVWRPIAWCSFVLGKFDQSKKYYNKLLDRGRNPFDLMNLGHVEWCQGNRKLALDHYRGSIVDAEMWMDSFLDSFQEELQHLIEHGVDREDIPIVLDHLRYLLEE